MRSEVLAGDITVLFAVALMPLSASAEGTDEHESDSTVSPQEVPPSKARRVIIAKRVSTTYMNYAKPVGSCSVGKKGGTCTISKGETATASISTSLGVSKGVIAGTVGFSASESYPITASCSSPELKKGETWTAWPKGDRWAYKVQTGQKYPPNTFVAEKTSGTLYAFKPHSNAIVCG
jgi:hypothetical protein